MPALSTTSKKDLEAKYKLVADTIHAYPLQVKQAWDEIKSAHIPKEYKDVENVVFCGMGGSALGARMVDSLVFDRLRVPFEIFNDYKIPNYINSKSLVIVSSYSGSTEETIESTYQAIKRRAKVIGITTGGPLASLLMKEKALPYVFEPIHNPSSQPRMAIGYAFSATLAILSKLSFITVTDEEVDTAISHMHKTLTEYSENAPSENNLAKIYAGRLKGRAPVLVASDHLVGCVHTIKNQFNESSKTFATLFEIPELNHHLLEGLRNPSKLKDVFHFIFFNSDLYSQKIQKRYALTAEVVEKNMFSHDIFTPRSKDKLSQVLEVLVFGSFVSYYLTKSYGIDPLEIPWVDYFKKQLAKS